VVPFSIGVFAYPKVLSIGVWARRDRTFSEGCIHNPLTNRYQLSILHFFESPLVRKVSGTMDSPEPDSAPALVFHRSVGAFEQLMSEFVSSVVDPKPAGDPFEMTASKSTYEPRESVPSPPTPEPAFTDAELQKSYDAFKTKKILPDIPLRQPLLNYARRQSINFIINEDYDSAAQADAVVRDLWLACTEDATEDPNSTTARSIQLRLQMLNEQQVSSQQRYDEAIKILKALETEKIEKLVKEQELERQQFEQACQAPEFLQRFCKPSSDLLEMREVQRNLALAHSFEEAKVVKARADIQQSIETGEAERRAMDHIRKCYTQMVQRQNQQLTCARECSMRKIMRIKLELARQLDVNQHLQNQLRIRLAEVPTKKGSKLPPLNLHLTHTPPPKLARERLFALKGSSKVSMLDVHLTDLKKAMVTRSLPS
jgi:hypothetical protein